MTLQGVVFDLDGTLLDSEGLWAQAESAVAAAGGVHWTEDDAFAWFGRPLRETATAIVDRGMAFGVDETIDRMIEEIAAVYSGGIPWLPGAERLLSELHTEGVPAALGTMSYRRLADAVCAAAAPLIRTAVGGDEVARGKPAPDVFLAAIDRLGLTPLDVVVVEDSPTGVAAAVASGAAVLAVPPTDVVRERLREHPRVSVVRSLTVVDVPLLREIRAGLRIDLW